MSPQFYDTPDGFMEISPQELQDLIDTIGGDAPNLERVLSVCNEYAAAGIPSRILWDTVSSTIRVRCDETRKLN